MLWPVLAAIGFLVLTTVVIVLGTQSTRRYEAASRDGEGPTSPAEALGPRAQNRGA